MIIKGNILPSSIVQSTLAVAEHCETNVHAQTPQLQTSAAVNGSIFPVQ
jgi:hypothetical protein